MTIQLISPVLSFPHPRKDGESATHHYCICEGGQTVNEQFESDVMQDLMGDAPVSSADAALDEDAMQDEFEADGMEEAFDEDGMMDEEAFDASDDEFAEDAYDDGFDELADDEFVDEFAEDSFDAMEALEEAVADALGADSSDEFIGSLLGNVGRFAGMLGRGVGAARQVMGTAGRMANTARRMGRVMGGARRMANQARRVHRGVQGLGGMVSGRYAPSAYEPMPEEAPPTNRQAAGNLPLLLQQMMPILQQHMQQGVNEADLFEDLADWFEEEHADAALPIIAGVAARAALRPIVRQGAGMLSRQVRRQVVRRATQAARQLVNRQGPRAVRALNAISRSVGRAAVRSGVRPAAVPAAIQRTTARVVARPALVKRLTQRRTPSRAPSASANQTYSRRAERHMVFRGPGRSRIEINIYR